MVTLRWGKRPRMIAYRDGKLHSSNLDKAFILNGFSNWKDASWPLKHDSSRCHLDSVMGRNSCVQYVCDLRCSNITIIRNISSNIPTKLIEFINWNCTQDAIKMLLVKSLQISCHYFKFCSIRHFKQINFKFWPSDDNRNLSVTTLGPKWS